MQFFAKTSFSVIHLKVLRDERLKMYSAVNSVASNLQSWPKAEHVSPLSRLPIVDMAIPKLT